MRHINGSEWERHVMDIVRLNEIRNRVWKIVAIHSICMWHTKSVVTTKSPPKQLDNFIKCDDSRNMGETEKIGERR